MNFFPKEFENENDEQIHGQDDYLFYEEELYKENQNSNYSFLKTRCLDSQTYQKTIKTTVYDDNYTLIEMGQQQKEEYGKECSGLLLEELK